MNGKVRYATPMKRKGSRVRKGRAPITVNGKVPPRRLPNAERRPRECLTPEEAERLLVAARKRVGARNPHRDATMILLAYRHGLRASELCATRWDMLDLAQGRYHVTRRKNGRPSVHLLRGQEIRALRQLKREQVPESVYAFTSERRGPIGPRHLPQAARHGRRRRRAPFPVHPHMPRHACGHKLAHDGHDTRALQPWRARTDRPGSRRARGYPMAEDELIAAGLASCSRINPQDDPGSHHKAPGTPIGEWAAPLFGREGAFALLEPFRCPGGDFACGIHDTTDVHAEGES